MATAPEDRPRPDQIPGAPHPSETRVILGQDRAQTDFLEAFNTGRLHSGWLITGPKGVGKATLAWRIAGFLLSNPLIEPGDMFGDPSPAKTLDVDPDHSDMRLLLSGAHPRLFVLRRGWNEKSNKLNTVISVDDVRKLRSFFAMSAADGGRRVVIVDPADELNVNAANAILKVLEEPPADTIILMIAHQPSRLLPTIRSRCRVLRCELLNPRDLSEALAAAGTQTDASDALSALSNGSVGEAIRLVSLDGLKLYGELVQLMAGRPEFDRPQAIKLADSCAGAQNVMRFDLALDLIDTFLARVARTGLHGPPEVQAAAGEALLLAKLCPHNHAARDWAQLAQEVSDRTRHGKAVNLDPAALILDTLFRMEKAARAVAA